MLLAALGLALLAAILTRGLDPGPATVPAVVEGRPAGASPAPARASPEEPQAPGRDPFRFADVAPPGVAPRRTAAPVAPRTMPQPSVAPVRLVGFVRKDGRLRAALAVGGEVFVAGVGERVGEYSVVAVDEEAGVRLRDAGGLELTLPPPS